MLMLKLVASILYFQITLKFSRAFYTLIKTVHINERIKQWWITTKKMLKKTVNINKTFCFAKPQFCETNNRTLHQTYEQTTYVYATNSIKQRVIIQIFGEILILFIETTLSKQTASSFVDVRKWHLSMKPYEALK